MTRRQIYLESDLGEQLRNVARDMGWSAAAIIREALRRYLPDVADVPGGLVQLRGLGKELWADENANRYVDRVRETRLR